MHFLISQNHTDPHPTPDSISILVSGSVLFVLVSEEAEFSGKESTVCCCIELSCSCKQLSLVPAAIVSFSGTVLDDPEGWLPVHTVSDSTDPLDPDPDCCSGQVVLGEWDAAAELTSLLSPSEKNKLSNCQNDVDVMFFKEIQSEQIWTMTQ